MSDTTRAGAGGDDVVVGVDGSAASVSAVRYGIEAARRSGGRLRLVHVLPAYVGTYYPFPLQELEETGEALLRTVLEQVGPIDPEVRVRSVLRRGSPVPNLVADARPARLLVVGADRRPVVSRLLTGNVTTGVTASSAVPVVSVPETWTPAGHRDVVLVGVKSPLHAVELLDEAFDLAHRSGRPLLVLHAWKLPSGYDDIIVDRVAHDEWARRSREELADLLAHGESVHPDVEVEVRVVHDQAAHALVVASREADEVVLVRRAHGVPAAVHLGATARTVLREADCPVRVVPPGYVAGEPALALEEAGEIRK